MTHTASALRFWLEALKAHSKSTASAIRRAPGTGTVWLACALCGYLMASRASAEWSQEKLERATEYLQQYRKDWTLAETRQLVTKGGFVNIEGSPSHGGTSFDAIKADDGRTISLMATGDSLLVDGKDVSGNLGSKTTYGAGSPIIENNRGSRIAVGAENTVGRDATTNYSLTISLSLALSASVALNLYLLWRALVARTGSTRGSEEKIGAPPGGQDDLARSSPNRRRPRVPQAGKSS